MPIPVFGPPPGCHPMAPLGQFLSPVPALLPVRRGIMRLQQEIAYVDRMGRVWRTPALWCIDGCSIPWLATWRFDRWDPRYLRSAGIHDGRFCIHDLEFTPSNDLFGECLRSERWHKARTFRWAVGTPCGWYSYNNLPDLPENDVLLQVMRARWESRGVEWWTPDTEPKKAA